METTYLTWQQILAIGISVFIFLCGLSLLFNGFPEIHKHYNEKSNKNSI